jgi:hypothetical protein
LVMRIQYVRPVQVSVIGYGTLRRVKSMQQLPRAPMAEKRHRAARIGTANQAQRVDDFLDKLLLPQRLNQRSERRGERRSQRYRRRGFSRAVHGQIIRQSRVAAGPFRAIRIQFAGGARI